MNEDYGLHKFALSFNIGPNQPKLDNADRNQLYGFVKFGQSKPIENPILKKMFYGLYLFTRNLTH